MAFDKHPNLALGRILTIPSPAVSGTTLTLVSGQGTRFPDPAVYGEYNATIFPTGIMPTPDNAEIVRITAKSTDTLTITRAQESSTARTVQAGDTIIASATAKTFTDIEDLLTGTTGWSSDIIPTTDSTYDLGSTAKRWAELWADDVTITNDISVGDDLTVTGDVTSGGIKLVKPFIVVATAEPADYVCDGTADDVQIQAAIDAVSALGGGTVFIKAGTYNIAATITFSSNVVIAGESHSTILKPITNFNSIVLKSDGRINRSILRDFVIDGNTANQSTSGTGIEVDGYYNLFDNLWVVNCKTYGLYLNPGGVASSENRIVDGRYNGDTYSVYIGVGNNDFYVNNVSIYGGTHGLHTEGGSGRYEDVMVWGSSVCCIYTTYAGDFFNCKLGTSPIGLYIDGTAQNVIGLYNGLGVTNIAFSGITDHCFYMTIGATFQGYLRVNGWRGGSTNNHISLDGDGIKRIHIFAVPFMATAELLAGTINDESVINQPGYPTATVPVAPVKGMIYLDDGTNTTTLQRGYRRYTGTVWQDLGMNTAITIPDAGNIAGLTITQNDVTNNKATLVLVNTGSGNDITAPNFTLKNGVITNAGDITDYENLNDGSPEFRLGSADAEELHIQTVYDAGAKTIDYVLFQTDVASATADKGQFKFNVDGTEILRIDDGGIEVVGTVMATLGIMPDADDGAYLGQSGTAFSDLFLASGAVINFAAGDITLTHSANALTLGGGDLALGANNLSLTGSIGATGARVLKGWFDDLEVTNDIAGDITGNAATVTGLSVTAGKTLTVQDNVTITGALGTGAYATIANYATLASPTFTGTVILPKAIEIQDTTGDHQYVLAVSELTADRTVTLPLLTAADTFVFNDFPATLTEKIHKLTAAPATDHTVSGTTIALVANENQAFGDVCYINSDGEAQLIDADAIATMSGIVMCADATIDADASGNYLVMGIARDDTWAWTVGGLIYGTVTGTTGNTLSQTAPSAANDVVQIMGVATHADRMLFKPSLVQVELT